MTDEREDGRKDLTFEIKDVDLAGRLGELSVGGRKVRTPALMPVVNPNLYVQDLSVSPGEMLDVFGFNMIITNSYIIRKNPELLDSIREQKLHSFLDFPGIIMTDSGTFQSYMYSEGGEVDVDPYEIVRFQHGIGSEIGTILDRFTVPDKGFEDALSDLTETLDRAKGSMELGLDMTLAVPVQGGKHLDLRERSGRAVRELGAGYAPIGGVVPIMESYDYSLLVDVIAASKKGLGPSIPAHLFGAGHPMILPLAVALGCDLFDSASYAKFAKDDRYMTDHRTYHLKEMENLPCSCPVCSGKMPKDLVDLPKQERYIALSRHNLWTLKSMLDSIRSAIKEGTLWEIVERSATFNPHMYSAVRRLKEHWRYLEENAPRSSRRFSCCTGLGLARPEFHRYEDTLLDAFSPTGTREGMVLTDWRRSYSRRTIEHSQRIGKGDPMLIVRSPLGPIPYDLMDIYPLSQSIFSSPDQLDPELKEHMMAIEERFLKKNGLCVQEWDGDHPLDIWKGGSSIDPGAKVSCMIDFQFPVLNGKRTSEILFPDPSTIKVKRSRKTGKIRNILAKKDGEEVHLLSMRADDGHLNLKTEAAILVHDATEPPYRRVKVESETAIYNAQGYNVFCKFVKDADQAIRPGDEVLITDEEDRLHAVGIAAVQWRMMVEGSSGIAVKVREGVTTQVQYNSNSDMGIEEGSQ